MRWVVIVKHKTESTVGIIDEYHAHKDDTVKENLESSTAQRTIYHHYGWCQCAIGLQAIENQLSRCSKAADNSLWIMIHDIDQEDLATEQSWENGALAKANPLLGQDWQSMPSKRVRKSLKSTFQIRNFKTKNLNMWVDQEFDWIYNEIWMKGKVDVILGINLQNLGAYAGLFQQLLI
jgi:phage terminase large subunit-like protein